MLTLPHGWQATTERGPNWLLVRLRPPQDTVAGTEALAEVIYKLLDEHSTYRVVLDLEEVPAIRSAMINELLHLRQRVGQHDGIVRLCGLSGPAREVIRAARLDQVLSTYATRTEAVMAGRTTAHAA